jgi:hypothetical protein
MTTKIKRERTIVLKENKGTKKGFVRKVKRGPECKLVKFSDENRVLKRSKLV